MQRESYLNLTAVQVHRHDAVNTHCLQQARHISRRDGHAGLQLAVLSGVAVVRNDGGDLASRRAAHGRNHQQELHQGLVHGRQSGLHKVHVLATNVLVHLDVALTVGEAADGDVSQAQVQVLGNLGRKSRIGVATEDFDALGQV